MKNPFFSIIIPTYNRENFILDTIRSVQIQTFQDFEIIIVDDGSTDNTKSVISTINDERITYIYQENAERSVARNNGGNNSNGKYLIFLDSDDFFKINHLSELFNFIKINQNPNALIISNFVSKKVNKLIKFTSAPLTENLVEYFFNNPTIPARVCIHRNIFNEFKFNEKITIVEDSILWSDISLKYPILINPNYTVIYNLHENNSVNLKNYSSIKRLRGLRIFFKTETSKKISKKLKRELISNCYYKIAQSHELHNKKIKCIINATYSIFCCPINKHSKSKLYLILTQIPFFKIVWNKIFK